MRGVKMSDASTSSTWNGARACAGPTHDALAQPQVRRLERGGEVVGRLVARTEDEDAFRVVVLVDDAAVGIRRGGWR